MAEARTSLPTSRPTPTGPVGLPSVRMPSPSEFAWVSAFLREATGIELRPGKEAMVAARLAGRVRDLGLSDLAALIDRLRGGDEEERQQAIDLLTTNETFFFRESEHFAALAELAAQRRPSGFRVWSAACSTGEEAYSIAMTLASSPQLHWDVVGTDVSVRVVTTATQGLYPMAAAERIPPHLLKAYCLRGREEYEGYLAISPALRGQVHFAQANLLRPPDLGRFDVVFLRNVMIYFATDTKRAVLRAVHAAMHPGAHLIIGTSESLKGLNVPFEPVRPSVYRKGARP